MNYPFLVMNRLFVFILLLLFAISSFTSQENLDRRTDYTTLDVERFSYNSMNRLIFWMTGVFSYYPTAGLEAILADNIRELAGDEVYFHFDGNYEPTKEGWILEHLIDKFYIK